VEAPAHHARLVANTSLPGGTSVSPELVDFSCADVSPWRIAEVVRTGQVQEIEDTGMRLGGLKVGPYPELPKLAFALPIVQPGSDVPAAVMVAGVSARLPMDEPYRGFFDLLAAGVGAALANARAYEEERRKAEALAEIDRAKTSFFSNVSHEFRTPLTLMLGPLEDELGERSSPLPPARRERLETAHRNSLRLLKLVNTLLDFSRIEAGRVQASYEATDLAAYTAELVSGFRSAIEKGGLTLTLDCPRLPELVYVDREIWEKVVLNLLSNAFKHTFEGGIRVRLAWCGDHVDLVVSDSGIGIPEAEIPRLFDRFHRVSGARSRSHEGTGIGLALVQDLIRLHGGTVRVESREGEGTTFTVTVKAGLAHLPADRLGAREVASSDTRAAAHWEEALQWVSDRPPASLPPPQLDDAAGASRVRDGVEGAGARRARILWADDNADMRAYVSRLLGARYDVTAVPDGTTAIAAALAAPPDLVLTDVMMPGLDGFGVLRQIRADERTRTIPVILLSARAGEESAVEGLEAGADDYLVKPFSARELLARVRTHLEMATLRREWALELQATNEELEAFSYSVSHDLRLPLRTIDGFSRALEEALGPQLSEEGRRHVQIIREGAQRMSALIDDLLALSRLGRRSLSMSDGVDMDRLVRETLEGLAPEHQGREINLRIGPLPPGRGDRALLKQVWTNLLSNAFKYTRRRDAALIEIGATSDNGETVYLVRDNGAGFDMRYAKKLFRVFKRLHRDEEFEGTGVGLAIVQRIVHRHGGRVWAESALDQGATFRFTLESGTPK
jgi:signal transduction histidine kinase